MRDKLPAIALKTSQKAEQVSPGLVKLDDGGEISATAVLDVRGGGDLSALEFGWQKFHGQMLRLKEPHGLDRPVIMDATVDRQS